jgi:hypothetical protein
MACVCASVEHVLSGNWGIVVKVRTGAKDVDGQHGRKEVSLLMCGLSCVTRHVAIIKEVCFGRRFSNAFRIHGQRDLSNANSCMYAGQ